MTKQQIEKFIEILEPDAYFECDAKTQKNSRKILTNMGITIKEQDEFLHQCEELGGYCDCEIIFNAKDRLLK